MPDVSTVHTDAALTNLSLRHRNNQYISDLLFPTVGVAKQSDKYYKVDEKRESMRQHDDRRAPGAPAREIDFEVSTDSYFCEDHALGGGIPDEERANADSALQAEINRVEFLTDAILLNKEIAQVAAIQAALANEGTNLTTLTDEWDDFTNGDPVGDIDTAHNLLIDSSLGVEANTLVLPKKVLRAVVRHPDVLDRIKYGGSPGQPAITTEQALAAIFNVDRILVPKCFKNTAKAKATASMTPIWSENDVLLAYIPEKATGLRTLALGLTFAWNVDGTAPGGVIVQRWREEKRKRDAVRVERYYDQKIVVSGCGQRIANTLS